MTPASTSSKGIANRRLRFGLRAAIIALTSLACLIMVNLVMMRVPARFDITAVGDQRLSPRTRAALDRLRGNYEIVLAGAWSAPDGTPGLPEQRVRRQVFDVLSDLNRTSSNLSVVRLDTMTTSGQEAFQDLLQRLASREQTSLDAFDQTVRGALAALAGYADSLAALSPVFERARDAIPAGTVEADRQREGFDTRAGFARILSGRLREQVAESQRLATERLGAAPVARLDQAASSLATHATSLDSQLGRLASDVQAALPATLPGEISETLRATIALLEGWRGELRRLADDLRRLKSPDVLRVARFLESGPAALVIGPPEVGMTAISFEALFPTPDADRASGGLEADARRHAEEVLTTALTTLTNPVAPIVVFVHGEGGPYLLDSGAIEALQRRLELNRIAVLEWAPVVQPAPPPTLAIDPSRQRPIVYIVMGTDSSAGVGSDPSLSGPARASALARAINQIIDAGDPLLVSLAPSTAPSWGGIDEIAKALEPFGLRADTGRPVLREEETPQGRQVESLFRVTTLAGEHPVLHALTGLPTQLRWPVAIEALPSSSATRTPLFEIAAEGAWAEAEWLGLWRYIAQNRVDAVRGDGLPVRNEGVDLVRGPWTVGYLAQRPLGGGQSQRLAAIGANGWFFDSQMLPSISPAGTTTPANPGNIELFNACLYWLAGQDELIAPGPASRAVARIRPMSASQRSALSWGLIAGLPLGVLGVGLAVRLWRG